MQCCLEDYIVEYLWISDLIEFVIFALDQSKYSPMAITIDDVLKAHNDDGYLMDT